MTMDRDTCDICDGRIRQGDTARLLSTSRDDVFYGHARCIDLLVETLQRQGHRYLGDVDLRGRA